ncbi:hypothetical protein QTN47_03140 [Danxiaibacter flavus]|uniref:DUF748 domain-containing protein n=1 Tax=Danxiaibacter flavus TaxID=3049108 RepID=A0ABV3ZAB8_9BACT|nr:hypothetical protein QNM32_03140 [Chitinophagaceae bacterium DXS]
MKISSRQRKWLKRILVLIVARFILGGIAYYIIVYRFKDIVQFVVSRESKKNYSFNASDIDVSLWHKTLVVNNAVLSCHDTLHTDPHHDVKIPRIYLAINSWKDLVFHKRVSVDSLAIILPELRTHAHEQTKKNTQVSFQTTEIVNILGRVINHLNVRSFTLQNGTFAYSSLHKSHPFFSNHINLLIRNFSKKEKSSNYVLSSEDIDLSLTDQNWMLPDGYHEVAFSKLHFSGKNGYFEIDSSKLTILPNETNNGLTFSAEKLFFKSKHLPAIYEQEKLILDTLICIRPVLGLNAPKTSVHDTSAAITESVKRLFKSMNFKYIDIQEGQIIFNANNQGASSYITQRTNLKLYNLGLSPDSSQEIGADSVQLNLKQITFVTPDSLFQMTIDEFTLHNNDIFFRNASFTPTLKNHPDKGFTFNTPLLYLKNISIENLIRKKLVADSAELTRPEIIVYTKKSKSSTTIAADSSGKVNKFYETLHGLRELINVKDFRVINGNLRYNSTGESPVHLQVKGLNADILLDHFLTSDSLIDIKRSLPMLLIKEAKLNSPKINLVVNNYQFDGFRRHNSIGNAQLTINNGISVNADNVYWEILDWDLWAQRRIIQIDALKVHQLTVNTTDKNSPTVNSDTKYLPPINVARLDIDDLLFYKHSAQKLSLNFNAENLCVDHIHTQKQFFNWGNTEGQLNNIHLNNKGLQAIIKRINLNSKDEVTIHEASVYTNRNSTSMSLDIPFLKTRTSIHSTDMSDIRLHSFATNGASLTMLTRSENNPDHSKTPAFPANIKIEHMLLNNTNVRYIAQNEHDTTSLNANVNFHIRQFNSQKESAAGFMYDTAALTVNDFRFTKKNMYLSLPTGSITLTKGKIVKEPGNTFTLNTGLFIRWFNGIYISQNRSGSRLTLNNATGSFEDKDFSLQRYQNNTLEKLLPKTTINETGFYYKTPGSTLKAASIKWNPAAEKLSIGTFSMHPNISRDEAFKNAQWQADYMTIRGDSATMAGVKFNRHNGDSLLNIRNISLYSIALETSRDKNVPFNHGSVKPMPTKLIENISYPMQIDSLTLKQSSVTIHEISATTKKEGIIPLTNINAVITNIRNTDNGNDSLTISANAELFDKRIRNMHYQESYNDSLSYFRLSVNASPKQLLPLSNITTPLAAVRVSDGESDTLFARFTGNKYAAAGHMNFYYSDLKVKLLNPNDTSKTTMMLNVKNWLANNVILRKKNDKYAVAYFERDQEKFVFNYWIKTTLHGIMSSVGIKSSKKYIKQYNKKQKEYSLPKYD